MPTADDFLAYEAVARADVNKSDIVSKAASIANISGYPEGSIGFLHVQEEVEKMLMGERKRCARVALAAVLEPSEEEETGDYEWASRIASNHNAAQIAVSIMKGAPA